MEKRFKRTTKADPIQLAAALSKHDEKMFLRTRSILMKKPLTIKEAMKLLSYHLVFKSQQISNKLHTKFPFESKLQSLQSCCSLWDQINLENCFNIFKMKQWYLRLGISFVILNLMVCISCVSSFFYLDIQTIVWMQWSELQKKSNL